MEQHEGQVTSAGEVTTVRVPTDVYRRHVEALRRNFTLGDDVKISLMATIDSNGDVRVTARGQTADEDLIVSHDVEPSRDLAAALVNALDDADDAIREELVDGIIKTLAVSLAEAGRLEEGGQE